MKLRFTEKADKDHAGMPVTLRKALEKQLRFLLANLHHPSLDAEKYGGLTGIWQDRVTRDWRFYFKIEGEEYVILSIIPHPKSFGGTARHRRCRFVTPDGHSRGGGLHGSNPLQGAAFARGPGREAARRGSSR